jgi:hypothetical protein
MHVRNCRLPTNSPLGRCRASLDERGIPPRSGTPSDACAAAWVFGGTGSWNDQAFEESRRSIRGLSEELYQFLNAAIVGAATPVHPPFERAKAQRGEESYGLAFCRGSTRHTLTSDSKWSNARRRVRISRVRPFGTRWNETWRRGLAAAPPRLRAARQAFTTSVESERQTPCLRCYDADVGALSPLVERVAVQALAVL